MGNSFKNKEISGKIGSSVRTAEGITYIPGNNAISGILVGFKPVFAAQTGWNNRNTLIISSQSSLLRIRYRTPRRNTTIEILLIPCIIRILILLGRLGSFLRKKYPPTSPREKNCFHPPFFRESSVWSGVIDSCVRQVVQSSCRQCG